MTKTLAEQDSTHVAQNPLSVSRVTLEERSDLVLALARVLYVSGQSTDQVLRAAEQLGRTLGLRAKVVARWGELQLEAQGGDTK
jgi:hypothetical protein